HLVGENFSGPANGERVGRDGRIGRAGSPVEVDIGIGAGELRIGQVHVVEISGDQAGIAFRRIGAVKAQEVEVGHAAGLCATVEGEAENMHAGRKRDIVRSLVDVSLEASGVGDGNRSGDVSAIELIVKYSAGFWRGDAGGDEIEAGGRNVDGVFEPFAWIGPANVV